MESDDWLKVFNMGVVFVASAMPSGVALYGLRTWHREHVGKRRIELAQETLVLFYRARDAVRYIRMELSGPDDVDASIEKFDDETEEQWELRKKASIPRKRYRDNEEVFNQLRATRYQFMVLFGKEYEELFHRVVAIVSEIMLAARKLSAFAIRKRPPQNQKRLEEYEEKVEKLEAAIWEGDPEEDHISQKMDDLIKDVERVCRSIIEGKKSPERL